MYLKTIFECDEEGIPPLRARIAERLEQSGPTVSETVARMERSGLLSVHPDRHIELSEAGQKHATEVMRRHRLIECLLVDKIGLEWALAHEEACRWEHVVSEAVEHRLIEVLSHPTLSPYGCPIPGLHYLGDADAETFRSGVRRLSEVVGAEPLTVVLKRIAEPLQKDVEILRLLDNAGIKPGATISAQAVEPDTLSLARENTVIPLPLHVAASLYIV
jgi:DtxR family Mn-dependent transcriptional regulator